MSVVTTVHRLRAGGDPSRPGKKQKMPRLPRDRKQRTWFRKLFRVAAIASLFGVVVAGAGAAYAWSTLELPDDKPLSQTTFVNDAAGQPLARFNAGENRTPVDLDEIPVVLRQAVIATEDRSFYEHGGVDPRGLGRAIYTDIRDQSAKQGGSTLSQQYVKTVYVGSDRTIWRKLKEGVLAMKLEQKYSKDEILNRYFNAVYFGRGAYGVQAASKAYFGKDVQQLELKESAYLAGLLKAPELADATTKPEIATQRRNETLNSMVITGVISEEQRKAAAAVDITAYVIPRSQVESSISNADKGTQYFVDYVRKILVDRYGEERVIGGGLQVKTTLDVGMQVKAYDSVYGQLKPEDPAGALVTVDANGYVKAMVGGRDWKTSKVNLAIGKDGGGSGRQGGSTFKPFTLAAAIENEDTCFRERYEAPAEIVIDDNGKDWRVKNYSSKGFGDQDLLQATANSTNTVYAQLNKEIGPEKTAEMARKAGVSSEVKNNLANVLGADSVTPLEMAGAYMTFAQNGLHADPNPILEVKTPDGETLEKAKPVKTRAMSENTAQVVNLALQGVVARGGTGPGASIGSDRPLAGKTGTTENNVDAWFVGYTPTLSTAVWMGYPEGNSRSMKGITGGGKPATIFANYMSKVAPNDKKKFEEPEDCRAKRSSRIFPGFTDEDSTTTIVPDLQELFPEDESDSNPRNNRNQLPDGLQDFGRNDVEDETPPTTTVRRGGRSSDGNAMGVPNGFRE